MHVCAFSYEPEPFLEISLAYEKNNMWPRRIFAFKHFALLFKYVEVDPNNHLFEIIYKHGYHNVECYEHISMATATM